MRFVCNWGRVAAIIIFGTAATVSAWAATSSELEPLAAPAVESGPPLAGYPLDIEMVVRQWVVCVSQPLAEELVRARAQGVEKARSSYADLEKSRSCGRFPELRVILRERVPVPTPPGHETRVFKALVNLSDVWGAAFVVYGGLPDE